jgi:serine/threonine protein phosphatase PrpC
MAAKQQPYPFAPADAARHTRRTRRAAGVDETAAALGALAAVAESRLVVSAAFASLQGRRDDNQDFGGYSHSDAKSLAQQGFMAAVADGVGGAKGGRVAAETCVRGFFEGYFEEPLSLGVEQAAAKCLSAVNGWIHTLGKSDPDLAGMSTTFTALLLRNRQAHVVHVGDSRVYRLRGNCLERLTDDHCFSNPNMNHVLCRAVGVERNVCADHAVHALDAHDRFLLCTDGLHAVLNDKDIRLALMERSSPDASAQALVDLAYARGSQDNITALVIDVINLPPASRSVLEGQIGSLPILDVPKVGQVVDGYRLERVISTGRYSVLFLATDTGRQSPVVLKFPQPRVASNDQYYGAFLREAWIGAHVHSPWVAEVIEPEPGVRSCLYTVMPFYPGDTLETRIRSGARIGLADGIAIGLALCKAIHALHRLRIIHRDIKPDNILLLESGGLKLLDLGVARLPAWDDDPDADVPGTASYLAPEQFAGDRGSESSDIYAAGVTLFRLFAGGAFPYGEVEPFSHPRFEGRRKSLEKYRPDLPVWLDAVLAKAVAIQPAERYADIMELAYDLENGLAKGGQSRPVKKSWYDRNPLMFWKVFSMVLLTTWIATLAVIHGS